MTTQVGLCAPEDDAVSVEDDAGAVASVLAGGAEAQREFFRCFAPHVERVLLSTLGPDDEIVDVLQDVFLEGFRQLSLLRDPSAVRGWLSAIAVHKARSLIRRRARRAAFERLWARDAVQHFAVGQEPETREALRAFYSALGSMSADLRLVFSLRYVQEMTIDEVATAMHKSPMTVKRWLAKAETRFTQKAAKSDVLASWLERERWKRKKRA